MGHALADTRRWVREGGQLFESAVADLLRAADPVAPSALPGWTRAHLLAHVAANAEALQNLVRWAATGVETPMYESPEQRAADISRGSKLPMPELADWSAAAQHDLDDAMDALTDEAWVAEVVTAQGRHVPASEIPWMRTRELWVHAVDLDAGVGFDALPVDLLVALCADVAALRSRTRPAAVVVEAGDHRWELGIDHDAVQVSYPEVSGPLPEVAAYLTGRAYTGLRTSDGGPVPELGPWL